MVKNCTIITCWHVEKMLTILEQGFVRAFQGSIKKGKYGIYAQWGKETKSLKEEFSNISIEQIEYIDVIRFLDKDVLDSSKPIGLVRELKPYLSIRTGKFGDYIYYKQPYARKPEFKKPQFLKLNGFNDDYRKCDKELLINWIKQTYNIT